MKTSLKILILITLWTMLLSVVAYRAYKDRIFEEVRMRFTEELSSRLDRHVYISSVEYVPLQSISMSHVSISSQEDIRVSIANANNIAVTVDLVSLVRDKQLKTTIVVDGLHIGDLPLDLTLRTVSHKANSYEEAFDPALIDSIFIMKSTMTIKDTIIRDICGTLQIDNMTVPSGKISFEHNSVKYLASFTARDMGKLSYDIGIQSKSLNFKSIITKDETQLLVEKLTGTFYALDFDFNGTVQDYLSSEISYALDGTIEANLEKFNKISGKIGKFAQDQTLSGVLKSDVNIAIKEHAVDKIDLTGKISSSKLQVGKIHLQEINSGLSLKNGELNISDIKGLLYGGTLTSSIKANLGQMNILYFLSMKIEKISFENLMRDIVEDKIDVFGIMNADLSLEGYTPLPETITGSGSIEISNADLGPVPIITPLLGNVFSTMQDMLPGIKKVSINQANANFNIEKRKISTSNLVFSGDKVSITAEGYVDFDGNLNFDLQNQLEEKSSAEGDAWPIILRNAIINFGNFIGKAHLGGTIKDPKWGFQSKKFRIF